MLWGFSVRGHNLRLGSGGRNSTVVNSMRRTCTCRQCWLVESEISVRVVALKTDVWAEARLV